MGKTKKSTDLLQKQVSKKENVPLAAEKKIKRAKKKLLKDSSNRIEEILKENQVDNNGKLIN